MTTLSVAMATFNGARFLEEQLESIGAQTLAPDELVVGDDRSTDDTLGIVEAFAHRYPHLPVRVHANPERLGSTRNFEQVVRRCTGDIVVFSDQDDIWLPERLARLHRALVDSPEASYVFSDGILIDERGRRTGGTLFTSASFGPQERAAYRRGEAVATLLRRSVVTGATLAVRSTALRQILPFEPRLVHDYYVVLALEALGRGTVLDEPLILYRRHAQQQIGVPSPMALRAQLRRLDEAYYRAYAGNLRALEQRLLVLGAGPRSPIVLGIREKARFCEARAALRHTPSRAPDLLWQGLHSRDYARYANGWKAVVFDALAAAQALVQRGR